jgi:transcriptional regulator with XRE-family HTH domain
MHPVTEPANEEHEPPSNGHPSPPDDRYVHRVHAGADNRPMSAACHDPTMPPRERAADRGTRLAHRDLVAIGADLRTARISSGLTLLAVGRACGMSATQVGRIERARLSSANVVQLARIGAVVGLDVRVRTYPGPAPIRDAGQVALMRRFADRLQARIRMRLEVPIGGGGDDEAPRDQRAWDAVLTGWLDPDGRPLPVEFDSRVYDFQAQLRRLELKRRDDGAEHVLWVVGATNANRRAVREAGRLVAEAFPLTARTVFRELEIGRHPGGSALVFA